MMQYPKGIEGDYLETKENHLFFDIKGFYHPDDRKISFLRFYPDPNGDREKEDKKYKKIYNLDERYTYLKENYPKYLFHSNQLDIELQGVKNEDIKTSKDVCGAESVKISSPVWKCEWQKSTCVSRSSVIVIPPIATSVRPFDRFCSFSTTPGLQINSYSISSCCAIAFHRSTEKPFCSFPEEITKGVKGLTPTFRVLSGFAACTGKGSIANKKTTIIMRII